MRKTIGVWVFLCLMVLGRGGVAAAEGPRDIKVTPTPTAGTTMYCDTTGICNKGYECVKPGPCPVVNGKETACAFRAYCRKITSTNPSPRPTNSMGLCKVCSSGNSHKIGDANCDGTVDLLDFLIWKKEFLANKMGANAADFNCDGKVDMTDFVIWKAGYINQINKS